MEEYRKVIQDIKGNDNIQINKQIIQYNNYHEIKEIALDIYHENAAKIAQDAAKIIEKKSQKLVEELITQIAQIEPVQLNNFFNPDTQLMLNDWFKASLNYDKYEYLLVKLAINFVRSNNQSFDRLIALEAIKTLQKLNDKLLDILSLFSFFHIPNDELHDLDEVMEKADVILNIFNDNENYSEEIQYLIYANCLEYDIQEHDSTYIYSNLCDIYKYFLFKKRKQHFMNGLIQDNKKSIDDANEIYMSIVDYYSKCKDKKNWLYQWRMDTNGYLYLCDKYDLYDNNKITNEFWAKACVLNSTNVKIDYGINPANKTNYGANIYIRDKKLTSIGKYISRNI